MSVKFCKRCSSLLRVRDTRSKKLSYECPRCHNTYSGSGEVIREKKRKIGDLGPERINPVKPGSGGGGKKGKVRGLRKRIHRRSKDAKGNSGERTGDPVGGEIGGKRKKGTNVSGGGKPRGKRDTNTEKSPGFFPFERIRGGQRQFLDDCRKAFRKGMNLVAYAPTGIGKTAASLVPALEAGLDHGKTVLFLTSKQSQHRMAIQTLRRIYEGSSDINRAIRSSPHRGVVASQARTDATTLIVADIISKQDMCPRDFSREHPAVFKEFCTLERKLGVCPYYKKKKDRKDRVYRKIEEDILHVEELTRIATDDHVCPHDAALEVASYAHVIICDYNYLFSDISDPIMDRLALGLNDIITIVDEAHNLPDRIRNHLKRDITLNRMNDALSELQEVDPQLYHLVKEMRRVFTKIFSGIGENEERKVGREELMNEVEAVLRSRLGNTMDFKEFYGRLVEEGEKRLEEEQTASSILHLGEFLMSWEQHLPGTIRFASTRGSERLSYRLLDPSVIAHPVFEQLYSAVLMSGTLFPPKMYADVLGLEPGRTVLKEYISPFPEENRQVYVKDDVTTLYKKRDQKMYGRIARHILEASGTFNGNGAVFFPSYSLLHDIALELMENAPEKQLIIEEKGMDKVQKRRIVKRLERLQYLGGGILLGVQGGSLSEGIDYPGGLLQMVMVVGVPLAPPSLEVNSLVSYYKRLFGASRGYKYSYLFPALSRVLQAAGRCIRSEEDIGVVILMDWRFKRNKLGRHLPKDLRIRRSAGMLEEIRDFFAV